MITPYEVCVLTAGKKKTEYKGNSSLPPSQYLKLKKVQKNPTKQCRIESLSRRTNQNQDF